jgi:ATP synthase protein I
VQSFRTAKEFENGVIVMNKKEKNILKAFAMVSQISITILVPICLSGWIGWWLDGQFHTQIWFVVMIVLGIGAAFRNVYYLTKSFYSDDMKKEHERLQYIEELKKQGREHAGREKAENVSGEQSDTIKK